MPIMEFAVDESIPSNESYLVMRAKNALLYDPYEAKAWMITAQTLFPHNFGVQFEAYNVEKSARNVKEAAKCFTGLFSTFAEEKDLWAEVQAVTSALRWTEAKVNLDGSVMSETEFLQQLFYQVPTAVQHALLLTCAEKTPDNMEHCNLMLLLFNKFPQTVATYGPRLMENLITAEKHSHFHQTPVNCYRKLLVCDLLPLLGASKLDIQSKNLLRLLHKAIEFYLSYLIEGLTKGKRQEMKIEEPWGKLWEIVLNLGSKLAWDLSITFSTYWNKDSYWTAILNYYQSRPLANEEIQRQIVYCTVIVLMRCLHEFLSIVEPGAELGYLLVEGFRVNPNLNEPVPKRCKIEEDSSVPVVTVDSSTPANLVHSFIVAVRCWDLLHANDAFQREFSRLLIHVRLDPWLKTFRLDYSLFKGHFEPLYTMISTGPDAEQRNPIVTQLLLLNTYYCTNNIAPIVETISKIASQLPSCSQSGGPSTGNLTITSRQTRHIHYLPLTRHSILYYCVKILLAVLKQRKTELTLGHMLVLIQLDWPAEEELLTDIVNSILARGSFTYPIFTSYVVNVDILEQLAYLSSEHGAKVPLDILPTNQHQHSQRRMSTRGVDKGAKEDLKLAIRRQVSRSNEPVDGLIIKFLNRERDLLHHSLLIN